MLALKFFLKKNRIELLDNYSIFCIKFLGQYDNSNMNSFFISVIQLLKIQAHQQWADPSSDSLLTLTDYNGFQTHHKSELTCLSPCLVYIVSLFRGCIYSIVEQINVFMGVN